MLFRSQFLGTPPVAVTQRFAFETPIVIGMSVAYVISFVIALLGNIFGIYIVIKRSSKRSMVHWLIANMACADLIVALVAMPYYIRYLLVANKWYEGVMGEITCKLIHYLFNVSIAASILTISIISLDRFAAIFLPLKVRLLNKPKTMTCVIWGFSLSCMVLIAMVSTVIKHTDGNYYCVNLWNNDKQETQRILKIFYTSLFVVCYALPLVIVSQMYVLICIKLWLRKIPGNFTDSNQQALQNSRRKVIRMLIVIVVVFALFWFPAHVMHYYIFYQKADYRRLPDIWKLLSFWLCQSNSAINPALYILLNESFRAELLKLLTSCHCMQGKCSLCTRVSRSISSSSLYSLTGASRVTGREVVTKITSLGKGRSFSLTASGGNHSGNDNAVYIVKIKTTDEDKKESNL